MVKDRGNRTRECGHIPLQYHGEVSGPGGTAGDFGRRRWPTQTFRRRDGERVALCRIRHVDHHDPRTGQTVGYRCQTASSGMAPDARMTHASEVGWPEGRWLGSHRGAAWRTWWSRPVSGPHQAIPGEPCTGRGSIARSSLREVLDSGIHHSDSPIAIRPTWRPYRMVRGLQQPVPLVSPPGLDILVSSTRVSTPVESCAARFP